MAYEGSWLLDVRAINHVTNELTNLHIEAIDYIWEKVGVGICLIGSKT